MGVIYTPGQVLDRGDLDVFLKNASGNPVNAFEITYGLVFVDPGPPEALIPIGDQARIPINPSIGEYFASLMIPPNASLGNYRIKWAVREFAGAPQQLLVQEFGVVDTAAVASPTGGMSAVEADMVNSLRILLRDWCVGGEETVELDVEGERMVVRLEDLHEILSREEKVIE